MVPALLHVIVVLYLPVVELTDAVVVPPGKLIIIVAVLGAGNVPRTVITVPLMVQGYTPPHVVLGGTPAKALKEEGGAILLS